MSLGQTQAWPAGIAAETVSHDRVRLTTDKALAPEASGPRYADWIMATTDC
jgi:hypothetical protein